MGEGYIQLSNISEEPPKTFQIGQKLEFFFQRVCSWGERICRQPKEPFLSARFLKSFGEPRKKKARTRGICNLWESDFIWRLGGGFGTPVVPRRGRLGPHTLERKNFGFSKMIDLVGKIWLRNFNVVLWNF